VCWIHKDEKQGVGGLASDTSHAQCELENLKVPKSSEARNPSFLAAMLDFKVTHVVGGDEDNLCLPVFVYLLQDLHGGWTTTTELGVPKEETLLTNVSVNETTNGWAESLFLIRANPNQVPVRRLNASRKGSTKTSTSADTDSTLVKPRCVRDTCDLQLTSPDPSRRVVDQALGEIALHTANQVVILCMSTLGDDTESVIFLDS